VRGGALFCALSAAAAGCFGGSGGGAAAGKSTTVFDPTATGNGPAALPVDVATTNPQLEKPFSSLDGTCAGGQSCIGVSILRDAVHFSRPARWTIRDASVEPGHSFIRYVSPEAYSFAVYERSDSPDKSWKDIVEHYEADVTANGAKALGQRVPVATGTNQGRAYTIDRKIESKDPILSRSREILLRGDHHVVLVQIVTQEESLSRISNELLEILRRVEVL
jgi:hypothetical protein